VITTSQAPAVTFDGILNVQVIVVDDCTFTLVAVIFVSAFIRWTVAPFWKFVPVRAVIGTAVPAVPSSGTIFLKVGLPADEVVVVAVGVVVVLPVADVVIVAEVVATVVGLRIGMEERGLLVIFSVLVFSKTARVTVSVLEFVR
jgi:hypothetical protein